MWAIARDQTLPVCRCSVLCIWNDGVHCRHGRRVFVGVTAEVEAGEGE